MVVVEVASSSVLYRVKMDALIPLLYSGEIHFQIRAHYNISKDVYWAFQRVVVDNEEPVLIIADVLNKRDNERAPTEES